MARPGRPTVEITLSAVERATLQRWARRHLSSQALAVRCRIVLACAEGGRTHAEIGAQLGCNPVTVSKWRHRFAADRLDGLVDAPRPGAVRTIGDDTVEAIVVETLESAPPDATHLSTRGLAAKHGISHTPRCGRSGERSASSRGVRTTSKCRPTPTELAVDGPYTSTQTPHDLRRLRLKGLIHRLPGTNRYLLTAEGVRVAAFYTKLQHRLLGPLLAADQPPAPIELRRALRVIDHAVDDKFTNARIRPAA